MSSTHRSLQEGSLDFPDSVGSREFRVEFDAPGLTGDHRRDRRPYLSYQATPTSLPVNVQISINGTRVVNETFRSTPSRTMTQIFDHEILTEADNVLEVLVPSTEPGSVTLSQLIVMYSEDAG